MPLQTIRFRIRPNGRVEELVEGMQGVGCQELTSSIEQRLGIVSSRELTAEHFQASANTSVEQNNHVSLQYGQN